MADILEIIAASKRREVEALKNTVAEGLLKEIALSVSRVPVSMKESILSRNPGIIAEHKRRSPSKGEIAPMSDPGEVARIYRKGGAAAMSVLTDTPYFGGSLADLAMARNAVLDFPLLRKEFIVDEYQLFQARIYGADAVLLIASMIDAGRLAELNDVAHSLGLQTLVEIHREEEVAAVPSDADMVGVNNRNLSSFSTDIANSSRLVASLPGGMVKIAESGISSPEDVRRLREEGFDGFLIGEALMKSVNKEECLRKFVKMEI